MSYHAGDFYAPESHAASTFAYTRNGYNAFLCGHTQRICVTVAYKRVSENMESVTNTKQGEDGRFKSEYDPEEFIDAVTGVELPTTADVAERVGCAHRTALHHLNNLEKHDRLTSRSVGRAKVWAVDEQ